MSKYKKVLGVVLTSMVAAIGSISAYKGAKLTAEATVSESILERMTEVEKAGERNREQLATYEREITQLQIALAREYDTYEILVDYLMRLPAPAWIKLTSYDDEGELRFVMWHINPAYERAFGISSGRYEGKTDEELGLWPQKVVEDFFENDKITLQIKDGICTEEGFPMDYRKPVKSYVDGQVCKWTFNMQNTTAIAGIFMN